MGKWTEKQKTTRQLKAMRRGVDRQHRRVLEMEATLTSVSAKLNFEKSVLFELRERVSKKESFATKLAGEAFYLPDSRPVDGLASSTPKNPTYTLKLTGYAEGKKIPVIRAIRESFNGYTLQGVVDLLKLIPNAPVAGDLTYNQANAAAKDLTIAGATTAIVEES